MWVICEKASGITPRDVSIGTKKKMWQTKKTKQWRKKLKKRKFNVLYARKNEDSKIPFEKATLSSAKMENAMDRETKGWKNQMWFRMEKSCRLILVLILYIQDGKYHGTERHYDGKIKCGFEWRKAVCWY